LLPTLNVGRLSAALLEGAKWRCTRDLTNSPTDELRASAHHHGEEMVRPAVREWLERWTDRPTLFPQQYPAERARGLDLGIGSRNSPSAMGSPPCATDSGLRRLLRPLRMLATSRKSLLSSTASPKPHASLPKRAKVQLSPFPRDMGGAHLQELASGTVPFSGAGMRAQEVRFARGRVVSHATTVPFRVENGTVAVSCPVWV
jgi:hypothetical protein